MKKTILAIFAGGLLISSCSKKEDNNGLQYPDPTWHPHQVTASKEETRPIIILRPVRPNGSALRSYISLSKDTTMCGNTINNSECQFNLTKPGIWRLIIVSPGYYPILKKVNYVDSFVYEIDTLRPINWCKQ